MKIPGKASHAAAVATARRVLLDRLTTAHASGTHKLPTIRQLAALAGVSHVTMQIAVRERAAAGALRTRQGSGLYVAGPEQPQAGPVPTDAATGTAASRTAHRLELDIVSGRHRPGTRLPLQKELCVAYGVGREAVRKALGQLEARSVVKADGAWYRVLPPGRGPDASGTVVVTRAGASRDTVLPDTRHIDNVMTLESACVRANLGISTVFYNYAGTQLHPQGPGKAPPYPPRDLESVLGFAVYTRGLRSLGLAEHLRTLLGYGKPVAVLDEDGVYAAGPGLPRRRNLRVFPIGFSIAAGEVVGRLLLKLGHRRIAYLDPFPAELWSQTRLAGLRRAFDAAGLPGAVVHVPVNTPPPSSVIDQSGRDLRGIALLMAAALDRGDSVQAKVARTIVERNAGVLAVHLEEWYGEESLVEVVTPVLDSLRQRQDITAYAAANDAVAIAAIRHLEGKGVRVPDGISVAGFDDGYAAQAFGLTSYNFNSVAAVQAMVDFIVDPGWRPLAGAARNCVVEVAGFVKERRTTGLARRSAV